MSAQEKKQNCSKCAQVSFDQLALLHMKLFEIMMNHKQGDLTAALNEIMQVQKFAVQNLIEPCGFLEGSAATFGRLFCDYDNDFS